MHRIPSKQEFCCHDLLIYNLLCRSALLSDQQGHDRRQSMPQIPAIDLRTPQPSSAQRGEDIPTAGVMSALASAPRQASKRSGRGQESWTSLIAGLSFSAAVPVPLEGAHAAARQPPPLDEGAPGAAQTAAALRSAAATLRDAQGPDQAQQGDRGRRSRMSELSFSETEHGPQRGSRAVAAQAAPVPAAVQPQGCAVPQRPHQPAQQQSAQPGVPICEAAMLPVQAQLTHAAAGREKRAMPEGPRQQTAGVASGSAAPAAKRRKVQGSIGSGLWDLANSVMLDMAQRLMPGAPSMQSAPPQVCHRRQDALW